MKRNFYLFALCVVLSSCSQDRASDSEWMDANGPSSLSYDQLQQLKAKAVKNDLASEYKLYVHYDSLPPSDSQQAVYWLRMAAVNGLPLAEYNLGKILSVSDSKKDQRERASWFAKARKDGENYTP